VANNVLRVSRRVWADYGKGQLKASVDAFGADAPSKVPITPDMIRKLYSITNVPKVANNLQVPLSPFILLL
jgi:hypothetical protein